MCFCAPTDKKTVFFLRQKKSFDPWPKWLECARSTVGLRASELALSEIRPSNWSTRRLGRLASVPTRSVWSWGPRTHTHTHTHKPPPPHTHTTTISRIQTYVCVTTTRALCVRAVCVLFDGARSTDRFLGQRTIQITAHRSLDVFTSMHSICIDAHMHTV